jgi:autotransporter-associated beta strand protein
VIQGTGGLAKAGTAILELASASTYTGATTISAGTLRLFGDGDISTSSSVTLSGSGTLSIATASGARTISNLSSASGTTTVSLGGNTLTVASSSPTSFAGVIAGTGGLTKSGPSTLTLTGGSANTFFGAATILEGTLELNKGSGAAIPANFDIGGGTLLVSGSSQIAPASSGTLSSGTFNLNGNDVAITSLAFQGGTLSQGGGILTLASTGTALTMRNTTIPGAVSLTGGSGGDVVFDPANNGTATIANLNVGSVNRILNVGSGTASTDMQISASSGSGGFTKQGAGTLLLTGTSNHAGGAVAVDAGDLIVNGSLTSLTFTLANGATLSGSGTITTTASTFNGTIEPGNSIGTLNLVGDQTFGASSTSIFEFNDTASDQILITGSLAIQPGATIILTPDAGATFTGATTSYTLITATGGVSGTFTNVSNLLPPFLQSDLIYDANSVVLGVTIIPFEILVTTGNASKVATCLDSANAPVGTDLESVLGVLRALPTVAETATALDKLQPSAFKGFILSQESLAVRVRTAISERANQANLASCPAPEEPPQRRAKKQPAPPPPSSKEALWVDLFADLYQQENEGGQPGFFSKGGGLFIGADRMNPFNVLFGGGLGYSNSNIDWKANRGSGEMQNVYGSLYADWRTRSFFIQGIALGALNAYDGKRYIQFSSIDRTAESGFWGGQGLAHLGLGGAFGQRAYQLRPYINSDLVYTYQGSFTETNANSLNLHVDGSHYLYWRNEAGMAVEIPRCVRYWGSNFSYELRLSYIREDRFFGGWYTANFVNQTCQFTVDGLQPHRNIVSPGGKVRYLSVDERTAMYLSYDAEFAGDYWDQNLGLQVSHQF